MTERVENDPETPLATLVLAGRSLADRQLDLALALGCERIVCLSQGLGKGLLALQQRAEAAGAKFNLIAGPRPLAGLVSAADELVVIVEGLVPALPEAKQAFESGAGVLALPVEAGIAAGFERIDLNHAWGGILAMPGRLVERLTQLPPDCDTVAALLRIALQGRVPYRPISETVLAEKRWALIRGRKEVADLEPVWLRRYMPASTPFAPGRAAARLAMRANGAKLLAKGWRPLFPAVAGAFIALSGVAAAWVGQGVIGLLACGLAWLCAEASSALAAIARAGVEDGTPPDRSGNIVGWIIDLALLIVLALMLSGTWHERIFAPATLLAVAILCARSVAAKGGELAQDRAILAVFLAVSAAAGALLPVIQLLALVLLCVLIFVSRGSSRLTQV